MAKLKFNPAAYQDLGAYALLKNVVENGHLVAEDATLPYKVYSALLTQSGTDAPIATILENTLGVEPTWYYYSTGIYYAESFGTWKLNKTTLTVGPLFNGSDGAFVQTKIDTEDQLYVITFDRTAHTIDDALVNTFIEIRVYN
jgi:hypothetical protein